MIAGAVAKTTGGVVASFAFSRTADPDTVEFDDAVVLKNFGQVPSDLPADLIRSALRAAPHGGSSSTSMISRTLCSKGIFAEGSFTADVFLL
jgi:hypothetical protein